MVTKIHSIEKGTGEEEEEAHALPGKGNRMMLWMDWSGAGNKNGRIRGELGGEMG